MNTEWLLLAVWVGFISGLAAGETPNPQTRWWVVSILALISEFILVISGELRFAPLGVFIIFAIFTIILLARRQPQLAVGIEALGAIGIFAMMA